MKNPELMMYRVAIGQILADAGINRTTIMEMVNAAIDERVEKYLLHALQGKLTSATNSFQLESAMRKALETTIRNELKNIKIEVTVADKRVKKDGATDGE